jgi:hypothetical protein
MKTTLLRHIRTGATLVLCMFPGLLAAAEIDIAPPPGKAVVVVYRPAKIAGVLYQKNTAHRIALDGQWISSISKGQHFAFYAWPGTHRIESPIGFERMSEDDSRGTGTLRLDVKAGETYYIKAGPVRNTRISLDASDTAAVMLMDKASALAEMAESTPVDWAKDLLEGTLAEVRALDPQAGATAFDCGSVEWSPDVDSIKTSTFKRSSILHGTLLGRDDAVVLQLAPTSADATPVGVTIPYADISAVEIRNKVLQRIVLITRKNGRLDSFSVLSPGGGRIDRDKTKSCGEQLAGKLGS